MIEVKYSEEKQEKTNLVFETKHWAMSMKAEDSKKLKKRIEKLVDGRKDWTNPLYNYFLEKISYVSYKDKKVTTEDLKYEESLLAIIEKWKKTVELREISTQKTIAEATKEVGGFARKEVKPLKKKR